MKVQVTMDDDMVKRIDNYAKQMSVSRSAFCSMIIGQGLMSLDKSMLLFEEMAQKYGNEQLTVDDYK